LDCIEQCVENIGDCDILWHDYKPLYENDIPDMNIPTLLECLKISEEQAKTRSFDAIELWGDKKWFHWGWEGMFNINLLNNLRFYPTIHAEDTPFGIILFAKAKQIKILNKQLVIHRIRSGSGCEHDITENSPLLTYSSSLTDMVFALKQRSSYKFYYMHYSYLYVCVGLIDFIGTLSNTPLKDKIKYFIINHANEAFRSLYYDENPRHTRELLKPLKPYMQKVDNSVRIAYFAPRLYKILKKTKRILKNVGALKNNS
ncbi:hypothetical protein BA723_01405, partial [Helicobacter sp. CLO-3]|uniref:hypothetical protein n=2 Tax=Helicobacter sp. CLO-3 TaxID=211 RepID=UPI000805D585